MSRCKGCGFGMFDGLVPRDLCRKCEAAANPFTREDFEHAARAAGKHSQAWADPGQINDKGGLVQYIGLGRVETWNPRDDDGDALRLAVEIGARIEVHRGHPAHSDPRAEVWLCGGRLRVVEPCADNDAAYETATRYAIFRAAIAIGIGKAMLPATTDNPTT